MVVHINEDKVSSLLAAAIMADEFMLILKVVIKVSCFFYPSHPRSPHFFPQLASQPSPPIKEERECFYCYTVLNGVPNYNSSLNDLIVYSEIRNFSVRNSIDCCAHL